MMAKKKGKMPAAFKANQKTTAQMARMGKGGSKVKPKLANKKKS
jgi:hypothetical protein